MALLPTWLDRLNKIRVYLPLLLICSLFMAAFPANAAPESSAPLKTVRLQLKWQHQFQFAGYYAALEQGYYRQAGLDVEILDAKDTSESTEKVLNGSADFGIAMSDLVLHRVHGDPVVALATIYQHSPLIFLSPHSVEINSIHDLVGKRVTLETHAEELIAYLEAEGIHTEQLEILPHTFNIAQLISGSVDAISAYSTDEPYALVEQGIGYNVFSPRSVGIDFYGDTLFSTEEYIKNNPATVSAFVEASLKGWEYALSHQEEIVDLILNSYSKRHSREHLLFEAKATERLIYPEVVEIGYMNPGRWEHIARIYAEQGELPETFSLEGFLYDKNPQPDLSRFYLSLFAICAVLLIVILIAARFLTLNKALVRQIGQRQEAESQLQEKERTLSVLMNNLPGMAYRCQDDNDWTMLFVSHGCLKLTGHQNDELISNRELSFNSLIHPDDRQAVSDAVHEGLNQKLPFQVNYRIKTKLGGVKWVWEQGQGIYSESGQLLFLEGFIADISEQVAAEAEKENLINQLQESFAQIKALQGIIPICMYCKEIRDDKGYWNQLEKYLSEHSDVQFSHCICEKCMDERFSELKG